MATGTRTRTTRAQGAPAVTAEKLAHSTPITLPNGDVVHVGRLGIDELLGLARTVLSAAAGLDQAKIKALQAPEGQKVADVVLGTLDLFDGATVSAIVAAAIGRDAAEIKAALDQDAMLLFDIVDALVEHNDVGRVVAVFRRAAQRWSAAR